MANVTQQIPNYLGGVTRIPDFNKLPGQVRDLLNGYPDTTYGLLKRPGTEFKWSKALVNDGSTNKPRSFTYHVIDREGDPLFLVVINPEENPSSLDGVIYVYNLITGDNIPIVVGNVYDDSSPFAYLGSLDGSADFRSGFDRPAYAFASDDQRTVIVNRTKPTSISGVTTWNVSDPGFNWADNKFRTVGNLGELPDSSAKVIKIISSSASTLPPSDEKLREGWNILPTALVDNDIAVEQKGIGLTIRCFIDGTGKIDSSKEISIVSAGYNYYNEQPVRVVGTNQLIEITTGLQCGYIYHVTGPTGNGNNTDKKDDYYMSPFSSRFDLKDTFFWVEVPSPNSRVGLAAQRLPHELVPNRDENGEIISFTWQLIDYSNRWVGNEQSNPDPSFVNSFIDGAFFYNNRLGFISKDKVVLSRPINYSKVNADDNQDIIVPDGNPYVKRNPREIDFFLQSAIQQNDGDPIDIAAANNKTSTFNTALSTPQGVVLFGDNSQSLLAAPNGGPLTPATASISNLSVYESDKYVTAITMDSDYYFIDQSQRSCRLHRMSTNFESAPVNVKNVSKTVQDWVPTGITEMTSSRASGFIILTRRDRNTAYIYKTEGELESWFKWKLPKDIMFVYSKNDSIYFVLSRGGVVDVVEANMFSIPNNEFMEGTPVNMGFVITPYLDYYFVPDASDVVVSGQTTTVTIPDTLPGLADYVAVTAGNALNPVNIRSVGFTASGHVSSGTRRGNTITFPSNFEGEQDRMIIGIPYNFEVEFPQFFFQNQNGADYTAYLTVARAKFAYSLSGDFSFKIKTDYNAADSTWTNAKHIEEPQTKSNYYIENTATMNFQGVATVPIHGRNDNFLLKIESNSPYPLSLDSCMWEGNYSPRYYRRN